MSCLAVEHRFRLLDYLVGWDPAHCEGLEGLDDAEGLRLQCPSVSGLTDALIDPLIPPPRLARGCDPCRWFLVTSAPPESRLMVLGACDDAFSPLATSLELIDAVAIAYDRFMLAVADRAANRVWVVGVGDQRIHGEAHMRDPGALAFTPDGDLLVAGAGSTHLACFDSSGQRLASRFPALPAGRVDRMAFGLDCALWLVLRAEDESLTLWRALAGEPSFRASRIEAAYAAFSASALVRVLERGFCIDRGWHSPQPRVVCWNWQGRPLAAALSLGSGAPTSANQRQGQLLTQAIDSGLPRCRWHRLRIDADVPPGTSLEVAVSASENPSPAAQGGTNAAPWSSFQSGIPFPSDWQTVVAPVHDALILQPAGRYLFVRIRLSGTDLATPVVRRVRLDLPRGTSADLLPAIYREDPSAADFTERFVALFDSTLEELDEVVRRAPALLDSDGVPEQLLPWIEGILGMAIGAGLPVARRRALLRAAPSLFKRRGTRAALIEAIRLATELEAVVEEPGLSRAYGGLAGGSATSGALARLNSVRLFGRNATRMRLDASELGRTRLRSYGDPDGDANQAGAFQVQIGLPVLDAATRQRIERLIEDMVPAHLLSRLTTGRSDGFWLLPSVKLDVDTRLGQFEPPVLGSPSLRLNRTTILPIRGPRPSGLTMGLTIAGPAE
jgi:phage tail-like protein